MSACQCCEQFPLDVVTLQARSASATLHKCGFLEGYENNEGCATGPEVYLVETLELTAAEGAPGPSSATVTNTYTYNPETGLCDYTTEGYPPEWDDPTYIASSTRTLSSEYTTSALIDNTAALLPAFSGAWAADDGPTASRIYDEGSDPCVPDPTYSEAKIQVRISHPPTATGYLKVWLWQRVRTYDPDTNTFSAPTDTLFDTYEWTGEPPAPEYGIDEPQNEITSDPFSVPRGDEQTSVQIVVAKWSLLPGYEPDDPIADAENDYALVRPSPDCLSNAVPALSAECPPTP